MTRSYSKRKVHRTNINFCRRLGYKKILLALCLFFCGNLYILLVAKSQDLNDAPFLPPQPKSLKAAAPKTVRPKSPGDVAPKTVKPESPEYVAPKTLNVSINSGHALAELSAHMREQVAFLRDAIEEAHRQSLPLAKEPKCTGDLIKGEVEDMLCIPRPEFLKEVKNPCWWDPTGGKTVLRCIPYFHILGCEKCATTDLWVRMTSHPNFIDMPKVINNKEANWWGWARYGRFHDTEVKVQPFISVYTNIFTPLTEKVEQSLKSGGDAHRKLLTGDGTPSDLMDFRGWVNITQNRGRKLPHVLTPHLMNHIYPETTKFIVIFRDPIERLYSDFCFGSGGRSAKHFHDNLLNAIDVMANCIRQRSVRECFFDFKMYRKGVVRLHLILYTLYLTEWLKVIPRDRFLFLKTEDYKADVQGTVRKCHDFLGVEPMSDAVWQKLGRKPSVLTGVNKKRAGPMWRQTKQILEEIVKPSMHFLPELLQDNRFVWHFNSTPTVEKPHVKPPPARTYRKRG